MVRQLALVLIIISSSLFSQQKKFEEVLGEENVYILNNLLKDFESEFIANKYSKLNTKQAYVQFLIDAQKGNLKLQDEPAIEENAKIFKKSDFKLDVFCYPDTVYVGKSELNINHRKEGVIVSYNCKKTDHIFTTRTSNFSNNDINKTKELVEQFKNSKVINLDGLFFKALKTASKETNAIELKSCVDIINTTGGISPITIIQGLLESNSDLDNYFLKRLLLLYVIYQVNY